MNERQRLDEGLALQQRGEHQRAREVYTAILETNPDCADAWHLLGLVDADEKAYASAAEKIALALRLSPQTPVFHHNLATVLTVRGDISTAEGHYREAIRLKPNYDEAFYNLSAIIRLRAHDPILDQIDQRLRTARLSQANRCFLHFAAGKLWDDLGAYERAFHHISAGNEAKEAKFDRRSVEDFFAAIKETFTSQLFAQRFGCGDPSDRPIFIVGMPRSGTSLIEQILASHTKVTGGGEMPDIPAICGRLEHYHPRGRGYPGALVDISDDVINGLALAFVQRLETCAGPEQKVVDKLPLNFRHLGLIALLFPRAKIIHARREARDTCLSCYFQNFKSAQDYAFDLKDLGVFYGLYQDLMTRWAQVLPIPMLEVSYEALIADPAAASRQIVAFCDLEWEPECLAFHQTKRDIATASRWQVRQPIYSSSIGRWKHYEPYLAPLLEALGPLAQSAEGSPSPTES